MTPDPLINIILFAGFNEVALPEGATLHQVDVNGYEISLLFKFTEGKNRYRQFYLGFNNVPTDYDQGILQLLASVQFSDGTSSAMIYEVYPYE